MLVRPTDQVQNHSNDLWSTADQQAASDRFIPLASDHMISFLLPGPKTVTAMEGRGAG